MQILQLVSAPLLRRVPRGDFGLLDTVALLRGVSYLLSEVKEANLPHNSIQVYWVSKRGRKCTYEQPGNMESSCAGSLGQGRRMMIVMMMIMIMMMMIT